MFISLFFLYAYQILCNLSLTIKDQLQILACSYFIEKITKVLIMRKERLLSISIVIKFNNEKICRIWNPASKIENVCWQQNENQIYFLSDVFYFAKFFNENSWPVGILFKNKRLSMDVIDYHLFPVLNMCCIFFYHILYSSKYYAVDNFSLFHLYSWINTRRAFKKAFVSHKEAFG